MARIKGCRASLGITYAPAQVERHRKFGDVTKNGVVFDYDLTYSGAMFGLIREAHHTDEDIERAAAELRRDRDVVGLINICLIKEEE